MITCHDFQDTDNVLMANIWYLVRNLVKLAINKIVFNYLYLTTRIHTLI